MHERNIDIGLVGILSTPSAYHLVTKKMPAFSHERNKDDENIEVRPFQTLRMLPRGTRGIFWVGPWFQSENIGLQIAFGVFFGTHVLISFFWGLTFFQGGLLI